jgi:hypothetical protein
MNPDSNLLDGSLAMVRDGKPAGEKWVVAGELAAARAR